VGSKMLKPQYSFSKETYDNANTSTTTPSNSATTGSTNLFYDDSTLQSSSSTTNNTSDNLPVTTSTRRPNKYSSKYGQGATSSGGSKTERIISKSSKSSPNLLSKDRDYEHFYTTASDRYDPNKYLNNSSTTGYNSTYLNHHTTHPYSHSNLNQYLTSSSKNYGSGTTGSSGTTGTTSSYYQPSHHHYLNNTGNMIMFVIMLKFISVNHLFNKNLQ
jgi:hypothetical protein